VKHDPIYCRVCGLPVDPEKDILFGAFGKPLFAAHAGKCASTVHNGVGLVGRTLRGLIHHKSPKAGAVLETIISAAQKANHG